MNKKNIIKQPELLAKIQFSAEKTGLNSMTDEEIVAEIKNYRRSKEQEK